MKNSRKSDLLYENIEENMGKTASGTPVEEEWRGEIRITRWQIPEKSGASFGCTTLWSAPIWQLESSAFEALAACLGEELSGWLERRRPQEGAGDLSVLAVGLGNRELTPDALGPETVRLLTVGRWHTAPTACARLSAFAPDVSGNTGIDTLSLIRGAVSATRPHAVLAIDALVAKSPRRLATVIQIFDGGITPASGVGEHRNAISEETLGVPVLALGIPTVVRASDLIGQALAAAEISQAALEETTQVFGGGLFVTPKEIDLILKNAALLLSEAIHHALGMGGRS